MKADLHFHGLTGFLNYWIKVQGYEGKNILKEIIDTAVKRDINIFAITSEYFNIPKGSLHDRFNWLLERYGKDIDTSRYSFEKLGDKDIAAILVDKKKGKEIIMLNGQTVIVNENGKRYDHLVVGSNQVPNQKNLEDTLKIGKDRGLIQIAEHPQLESHLGIGNENFLKYQKYFDAIEGHNSQLIFCGILSKLPVFKKYKREVNENTKKFAKENNKPWIATSDGHRIESLGISYIKIDDKTLDFSDGEKLLEGLKKQISSGNFQNHCNYENLYWWMNRNIKFKKGIKSKEHSEELKKNENTNNRF